MAYNFNVLTGKFDRSGEGTTGPTGSVSSGVGDGNETAAGFQFSNNAGTGLYYDSVTTGLGLTSNGSKALLLKGDNTAEFSGNIIVTGNAVATSKFRGNDNVTLSLGDSEDLKIYHDQYNSYIEDSGTGLLKILTNGLEVKNADDDTYSAFFGTSGATQFYYDGGDAKFETTPNGCKIIGNSETTGRVLIGTSTYAPYTTRRLTIGDTSMDDTAVEIRSSSGTTGRLYFTDSTTSGVGAYAAEITYDHGVGGSEVDQFNHKIAGVTKFSLNSSTATFTGKLGVGKDPSTDIHIASALPTIRFEDSDVAAGAAYSEINASSNANFQIYCDPTNVRSNSDFRVYIDGTGETDQKLTINSTAATFAGDVIVSGTKLNLNSAYIDFSGSLGSPPNTAAAIYRPADNSLAISTQENLALTVDSGQHLTLEEHLYVKGGGTANKFETTANGAKVTGQLDATVAGYQTYPNLQVERTTGGGSNATGKFGFRLTNDYDTNCGLLVRDEKAGKTRLTISSEGKPKFECDHNVLTIQDTSDYSAYTNGGKIYFQGKDETGTNKTFAAIEGVSQTTNNGRLIFQTRSVVGGIGGLHDCLTIKADKSANFTGDVTTPANLNGKNLNLLHTSPTISLTDSDHDDDFQIKVDSGLFKIIGGSDDRLTIDSDGNATFAGNVTLGDAANATEAAPHLLIDGSGYKGHHYLDGTAYYIGQNSANRSLRIYSSAETAGVALAAAGTSWGTYSDERLKENIQDIGSVVDKIKDIRCISYKRKDIENAKETIGFIAQDFVGKFDQVLDESKVKDSDSEQYYSIKYTETIPIVLKALQEAIAKIETLETKVAALESS